MHLDSQIVVLRIIGLQEKVLTSFRKLIRAGYWMRFPYDHDHLGTSSLLRVLRAVSGNKTTKI